MLKSTHALTFKSTAAQKGNSKNTHPKKPLTLLESANMSLQTDIQWIKSELDHVNDPDLIEVFKRLLAYRKSNSTTEFFSTTTSDLRKRAEASLKAVEKGQTRSLESFKQDVDNWIASQHTR